MNWIEKLLAWSADSAVGAWLLPCAATIVLFALICPLRALVLSLLKRLLRKRPEEFKRLRSGFTRPTTLMVLCTGIAVALALSPLRQNAAVWAVLVKTGRSLLIVFAAWFTCILEGPDGPLLAPLARRLEVDKVLFPFISKLLRFITIAVAALVVVQEWGYSISGLLTGLGLGGLAVALAAQDMLSNLFAGAVILMDRPFGIGDWIEAEGIEGTVEDINFRSVRIRTFSQALVTVPNAKIANAPITNYSRMGKRRVLYSLPLAPNAEPARIKRACAGIVRLLNSQPDIEQKTALAALESIGQNSLGLMVLYYTHSTAWGDFVAVRERMHYAILAVLEKEGVPIAPPQAVRLEP